MPPKKSRSRVGESFIKTNQADVQTEIDNNLELDKYKNQVKLLQQKIEDLNNEIIILKNENNILRQQNNKLSIVQSQDTEKVNSIQENEMKSEFISHGGVKLKGCTCKGNCSNKICGCVKKNKSCQEFCRCNQSLCKNQDLDKENLEQAVLSEDGQKVLDKLGGLTLNQEVLHASEKKGKRSIFSPFSGRRGTLNGNKMSPASPITFITKRRLFTQNSDELIDIRADAEIEKNSSVEERENQERSTESVDVFSTHVSVNEKTETDTMEHDPNIKQKSRKIRQSKKKVTHSPQALKENNELIYSNHCIDEKKNKSNEISPKMHKSYDSSDNKQLKSYKVKHSPQPTNSNIQHLEANQNVDDDNTLKKKFMKSVCMRVQHSSRSSLNKTQYNSEIKIENSADEISDKGFNPMIPKHQLPRSPVLSGGNHSESQEIKKFSPTTKELAVAEVDWEQHQAELVLCKICKRKFFPHRIEIHSKSCKGI